MPKKDAILSESESSSSSSSQEGNRESFQNTTLEVSEEEEDEDHGSNHGKESDFSGDLNPEVISQAESGRTYDVVRTHAVPNYNGVPNRAVPTAVQVNQSKLVNSIHNQWTAEATFQSTITKSMLDSSSRHQSLSTIDKKKTKDSFSYILNFGAAAGVVDPYNGGKMQKTIEQYIHQIANQQMKEPLVVYPLMKEPRVTNVVVEPPQEPRSIRSRGDPIGSIEEQLIQQRRKATVKPKKQTQEGVANKVANPFLKTGLQRTPPP